MRWSRALSSAARSATSAGATVRQPTPSSPTCEISWFWHHGQCRLQPNEPSDSTVLPGFQQASGFFSTGSTATEVTRPKPSGTIAPSTLPRARQAPTAPGANAQPLGQT